ncbi:DUF4254 domain-containing protein [Massilia sp. UMI-21]|nr:DUF4254 domain-containing protein [Massilia sp. UMI-21]
MSSTVNAVAVMGFHDGELAQPDWPSLHRPAELPGAWRAIDATHRYNCLLWQEEDRARRVDVAAAEIATSKRLIDRYNQQRHDLAACLDQLLREARAGQAYFKVYRQFKMYNDPALNPYLYGPAAGGAAQAGS